MRLFLANLKAPQMGNPVRGEPDKPWAFESKEFLRKLIIGLIFYFLQGKKIIKLKSFLQAEMSQLSQNSLKHLLDKMKMLAKR